MYTVKKQKASKFRISSCQEQKGTPCRSCGYFIDYKESCYYSEALKIYICRDCGAVKGVIRRDLQPAAERKYRNVPRQYEGKLYQSTKEANFAAQLDIRKRAKDIKSWHRQVKILLHMEGIEYKLGDETILSHGPNGLKEHLINYYCDFVIIHNDGTLEYIDIKSDATILPLFKIKWRLLEVMVNRYEPQNRLSIVK